MPRSNVVAFVKEFGRRVSEDGREGFSYFGRNVYESLLRHGLSRVYWPEGTPVFEKDWDVLLILDACRADMLREVRDEYAYLDNPGTLYSVDSASKRWMQKNFRERYAADMSETVYVTGNPYSDEVVDDSDFARVEEVWNDSWNDEFGTVLPRPITDRAITAYRELDPERILVHYMQPHYPFVHRRDGDGGIALDFFRSETAADATNGTDVWAKLKTDRLSESEVWNLYLENLRYVLDDLEVLLRNLEADTVVISSDHGNAFGEYGVYAHPPGMPFKRIREVPWYVTSATDTEEYVPDTASSVEETAPEAVDERLRDLGYL